MAFGDMKGYYIADRVGLSIEVFREVFGLRDLVVMYARKRLGAALLQPWRLKLLKIAA
jgi:HK97 family phage major capsid protein